jgi:hypothetical protein
MWCMGFVHWIPYVNASEMYHKKQSCQATLCNISDLLFNKESDYRDLVYKIVFILYTML